MNTFAHTTTNEIPPELLRSTPREVQLSGSGQAVLGLAIGLVAAAILAGLWLTSVAARDARRWHAWQAEAVQVRGEITALRKRGSGDNTKYYADYSYRAGERIYAGTTSIRSGTWRRARRGDPIAVSYRRSEPGQSWTPFNPPSGVPQWAGLIVAFSLLIPAPLLAYALRRQRRLLEEGRGAWARVTGQKKISSQHGARYRVEYEFTNLAGARRTGKFDAGRKPLQAGEEFVILYHPDEDNWSARYPLSLVKVRI